VEVDYTLESSEPDIPGLSEADIPGLPEADIPDWSEADIPGLQEADIPGLLEADIPGYQMAGYIPEMLEDCSPTEEAYIVVADHQSDSVIEKVQ